MASTSDPTVAAPSVQRELMGISKLSLYKLRADLQMYVTGLYEHDIAVAQDITTPVITALNQQLCMSNDGDSVLPDQTHPRWNVHCELLGISKASMQQLRTQLTDYVQGAHISPDDINLVLINATNEFFDSCQPVSSNGGVAEPVPVPGAQLDPCVRVPEGNDVPEEVEPCQTSTRINDDDVIVNGASAGQSAIDSLLTPKQEAFDTEEDPLPVDQEAARASPAVESAIAQLPASPSDPDAPAAKRRSRRKRKPVITVEDSDEDSQDDAVSPVSSVPVPTQLLPDRSSYSCPICKCELPRGTLASHISTRHTKLGKRIQFGLDATPVANHSAAVVQTTRPRSPAEDTIDGTAKSSTSTAVDSANPAMLASHDDVAAVHSDGASADPLTAWHYGYQCPTCRRVFTTSSAFARHKCPYAAYKPSTTAHEACPHCDCRVARGSLQRHIEQSHPIQQRTKREEKNQKIRPRPVSILDLDM